VEFVEVVFVRHTFPLTATGFIFPLPLHLSLALSLFLFGNGIAFATFAEG